MLRRPSVIVALLLLTAMRPSAQDATAVIDRASKAIGGDLATIQYSGSGASYSLGQSPSPGGPWPGATIKSYTASIDYAIPAMRQEIVRVQMTAPPAGVTAQTIAGEQRQVTAVSGGRSWNVAGETATPAPAALVDRLTLIWTTPHGFLRAARASGAKAASETAGGRKMTRLTFSAHGTSRMTGLLNDRDLVEKVETWVDNPVLGDMLVETTFSDYKDFGGITFPARIVQKQGGFTTLELTIASVAPNASVSLPVPDAVQQAAPPVVRVESQKLAEGVWYLTGGSHHSVAVEFKDHVVVIEGPQNEDRSTAVIAEVKKTIPGKAIRYLVNTHQHFDHSGGIRAYAAEGAALVTHEKNRAFYEKAFAAPRTIKPDLLAQSKKAARFETVGARKVLTDGSRTLELHLIQGSPHNDAFLMAYLPAEKILVEVDAYTPAAANAPPPATPNPSSVNLFENIERLKLDVTTLAPLHGRLVTLADLKTAIGR
jgi:glyoxylase-like metal-dependent hydrolase (beta-lactamase superfamily II)